MSEVDLALVRLKEDILGKASCNAAFSGFCLVSLGPLWSLSRPFPGFLRAPQPDALLPAQAGGLLSPLSCPVRGARGIEEQTLASEAAHCCSPQATVRSACDADKLHYSATSSSTMLLALVAEGIQWSHPTGRRAAIVTSIISLALNTSFSAHDCKYCTDNRPGSGTHHHLHGRSLQVMPWLSRN